MRIVLSGDLSRVFFAATTCRLIESDTPGGAPTGRKRPERDGFLFHRAGTLAALSCAVVPVPDWRPRESEEGRTVPRGEELSFTSGMSLEQGEWLELYDDAVTLARAAHFVRKPSRQMLAGTQPTRVPQAWDDGGALWSSRLDGVGATQAHLTELLLQAFLAWQADAVLVISENDCRLLAGIAEFLIDNSWPSPFPIPDLRSTTCSDGPWVAGRIANLGPEHLAHVEADRRNSEIVRYAQQLRHVVEMPTSPDVSQRLERAFAAVRLLRARPNGCTDEIPVVVGHAGILYNADARVPLYKKALACWARRRFTPQNVRLLALSGR